MNQFDEIVQEVMTMCVEADSYNIYTSKPDFAENVHNACCAAYAYGDMFVSPNVDNAYLFAVVRMRCHRWSIPMAMSFKDKSDPTSISGRARTWVDNLQYPAKAGDSI